jgi:hypothetical protein
VLKQSRKSYVSPCDIAQAYAFVGDKEHTLRYLELAYHERSPWIIFVQKDLVYDFLHSDQRYRALVKKIGLPPTYRRFENSRMCPRNSVLEIRRCLAEARNRLLGKSQP